ncbi:hypothetical protein GCM10010254_11070 [Streptomyces chromofuscus]|uniref:Uncharacterized protein n=2 Tax=Streptomyces chromofuscus TaxID=42881 RepID=A0A7M2T2Z4_STRCW|nr:hypothetical protein [Streptomyces chromofuscus]QOV43006.1 hypothetical protein IPT68_24935 [Streptomyces chromofuscus]GGS92935.1 hypothetical protein GCM10010254_11070 [Streptomyces chromofuscus]
MPDITRPDYFLQLARSLDRIFDDLPQAELLRRGDDISPLIHTVVSDLSYVLTEISEELATSNRHESEAPSAYSRAERSGTAALTQCAIPLGAALAHLGQVIDRLGFLHENTRQSATGPRTPAPGDMQLVLQGHLDQAGTTLRTAAQQLRSKATQLSRPHPARTATVPSHTVSDTVSPSAAPKSGRAR